MNAERDTDRQLRSWVSQGVDRAPERFVWAALDEIERMPQRPSWRTALDRLAARFRPAAALVSAAAVVVVAAVVAAQALAPYLGPGRGGRDLVLADLNGIVIWQDTMPSAWTLDNLVSNPDEVLFIPIRSGTEQEGPAGYLGGRYTSFSGPGSIFMSWGTAFEQALDADAALPFYDNEMAAADAWGLGPGEPITLGDGGFVYTGETTALTGRGGTDSEPAQIYLWRYRNVLLAVGGWFDFDAEGLRAVAEAMDARARALSDEAP